MNISELTVGFDATTQEGVHINSIHLTTKEECEVIAIDKPFGGEYRTTNKINMNLTICRLTSTLLKKTVTDAFHL